MHKTQLSTHEVAQILGVTPMSIIRYCENGQLPFTKTPGGHRRIQRVDVEAFAASRGVRVSEQLVAHPWSNATNVLAQIRHVVSQIPDVPVWTEIDARRAKEAPALERIRGQAEGRAQVRDAIRLLLEAEVRAAAGGAA